VIHSSPAVAVLQHIVFNRHLKIEEEDAGAQTEVISAALNYT